jgi:hypothetical protein
VLGSGHSYDATRVCDLGVAASVLARGVQRTLEQLKVVADLLQDDQAGQDEAVGAADAWALAAARLVPLALLRASA